VASAPSAVVDGEPDSTSSAERVQPLAIIAAVTTSARAVARARSDRGRVLVRNGWNIGDLVSRIGDSFDL